jgi:hypothetical protein
MRGLICLVALPLALATSVSQDKKEPDKKTEPPPKVLYAVPLVATPGAKQKLVLRGRNLGAVKEIKVIGTADAKAKVLGAKGVGVPNNYPGDRVGDSEVDIELDVPAGTKPGSLKLVAVNAGGESNAYTLLLRDDLPAVAEREENGGFDTAQKIPFPCAVEGTIKAERDVDVFRFEGRKGAKVKVDVQAARFGSPLDGFLTVYDADRRILASADDVAGSPDPAVTVTLPRDGTYFVSLLDAHDLGGGNFGYRLVVSAAE